MLIKHKWERTWFLNRQRFGCSIKVPWNNKKAFFLSFFVCAPVSTPLRRSPPFRSDLRTNKKRKKKTFLLFHGSFYRTTKLCRFKKGVLKWTTNLPPKTLHFGPLCLLTILPNNFFVTVTFSFVLSTKNMLPFLEVLIVFSFFAASGQTLSVKKIKSMKLCCSTKF